MGTVRGVLLDESVLVSDDGDGNPYLAPGSATLLRRLRYSRLRVGICYQDDVSPQMESFLASTASSYSLDCITINSAHVSESFKEVLIAWSCVGDICFYVTSRKSDEQFCEIHNLGWRIVCRSNEGGIGKNKELMFFEKLDELLILLFRFNKMAMHSDSLVTVGYVMKPSREEDFAKRGAFPMHPTENGLLFVPLIFELPLASQIQDVDVVVHKATDEIISIDPCSLCDSPNGISYSKGMAELERYIREHTNLCLVDPLKSMLPLLDRHKIQEILLDLESVNIKGRQKIRAPHFLKVDNFQEPRIGDKLSKVELSFPVIVKPQVACGVADAHKMALVFKLEDIKDLTVPLPSVIQEYVSHGSLLFKLYVLGARVFYAVKSSIPNADILLSLAEKTGFAPLLFDSLKSLPVSQVEQPPIGDKQSLDMELVNAAANWLRRKLALTIFGFDVVIQEDSGDHVVVDINYLPSFKEVPDSDAIPAFWDAIKSTYESWKAK